MMITTMEGVVLKLPPSIRTIKPNPNRTKRTFRSVPFATASAPAPVSSDSVLGPGSLGHLTQPDFPILHQELNGKRLVYLDNAATSQKPTAVLNALQNYYETYNSNVHRGIHYLSARATDEYELARQKVANFVNASDSREIVFTKNATEAINLVAYSWGLANLREGDEIVLTVAEHHSAIVPWQFVAQKTGAILKFVTLTDEEVPDLEKLRETLSRKTKLLVLHHVSNVLASVTHAVEGVCIGDEAKSKYSPKDYVVGVQKNLCNDTEIDEKKHAGLGGCARPEDGASTPKHASVDFSGDKNCDQFYTPEDISGGHVNNRLNSSSMSLRSNVDTKGEIFDTSLEKAGPTPTFAGNINDGEISEQNQSEVTSSKIKADGISICKSDGINVMLAEKKTGTNLLSHEVKLTVEVTVPHQFSEGGCKKDVHETMNMGTNSQQILSSPSVKCEFSERDANEKLQQAVFVLESGVEVGDKGKIRGPDESDARDCLSKSEGPNSDMGLDRDATGVLNNMDGSCSTSNDLKNHVESNAADREISVPVEGDPGSVDHVAQENAESKGSESASFQPDETVECGAEVSSSSAAGTSYRKMKFDLNEGFSNDDGKEEEHVSLLSSRATNVHMINPSQISVNSIHNEHSASITVAAAAKGPFVPPEDLLKSKGELRWKGSAATSAFRPAEPRKVETPFGSTNVPCSEASSSKHGRILLDFDLNVPDERLLEEMASRDSSFAVVSATDIASDRATLFNKATGSMPVRGVGGLDLDLNRVDEANDNGHCSSSSRDTDASIMHGKAVGGLPSVDVRRNFDLNDGPGVDEAGSDLLSINQQIKGSMPAQLSSAGLRMNGPGLGSYSSWFPPGNTFSTVAIPSMLSDREEQSFPIFPPNVPQRTFGPAGVNPFTSDIYRGSVLSASSAMSFPSSPFQFPIFPFGTTFPLPSVSFPVGGTSYADSASGPRLFAPSQVRVPPVNSQLLGHGGSVTSQFQRPFMVGLPDIFSDGGPDNNRKWGRQGLDLNAGPGTIESEARQEMLPLPSVQHSLSSTQALAEEHARMYSASGGILKRRETEGGLENENFRFKQSSWQ